MPNHTGQAGDSPRPASGKGDYQPVREAGKVRLTRDAQGRVDLHLADQDEPVRNVTIRRCFPWSVPELYASIRDEDGKERALLDSLDDLDPASREIAEKELAEKVFNPKILRVSKCQHEFGITTIEAETDRGPVSMQVRSRDDVRHLSTTRALLRDVEGNTFEIEDIRKLDPVSQKQLRQFF